MRKTLGTTQRTLASLFLVFALSATAVAQTTAAAILQPASDPALQRLEREIARLSTVSGGVVGVTAIHLETGRRVSMNGAERFPMASTFKVPIAVQLLTRIDKGEVKLDQMNDVGIITLPDSAGHVAIAAFVKSSEKENSARERAIAEIARAVHDFFLFQPRAGL